MGIFWVGLWSAWLKENHQPNNLEEKIHLSPFEFYFCGMSFCFINNNHLTCLITCVLRFLTQLAIFVKITVLLCDVV